MKISKQYLKKLIFEELSKTEIHDQYDGYCEVDKKHILKLEDLSEDAFELIEDQNLIKESENKIEELKMINEEIKRMKQLIDFRSPLLHK